MEVKRLLWLIVLLPAFAFGQNRYIVFFKDKAGTTYSVSQPAQFLSAKSIARRSKQQIAITQEDLPVNASYIAQVKATVAKTFFSSRWMNCLLIETTEVIRQQIDGLSFVDRTLFAAPGQKLLNGRTGNHKRLKDSDAPSVTNVQLNMLDLDDMQDAGYKGEGITIAVFDGGFDGVNLATPFAHLFTEGRITYTYDLVRNTPNVYGFDNHGTNVLSTMAAYVPDSFVGGSYKATYQLFVTEDSGSEYRVEEFNWLFAAEKADSAGVDVITSSLGYNTFDDSSMNYTVAQLNGSTAIVSQAAKIALTKGMVIVTSAGNEGNNSWKYVTSPADVKGVLAAGGVTSNETHSAFSSIGPTADNRIKPDVVALGSGVSIVTPSGAYGTSQGTSFAAPLIASLAAGVWQAFPQLTSYEVYDVIIRSADQAASPDNLKGYGVPHFGAIREYIETSQEDDIFVTPNPTSTSVKITARNPDSNPVEVSVFDTQGKLLSSGTVYLNGPNAPTEYDVSYMAAGIYLVKVKSSSFLKTIRLVKL